MNRRTYSEATRRRRERIAREEFARAVDCLTNPSKFGSNALSTQDMLIHELIGWMHLEETAPEVFKRFLELPRDAYERREREKAADTAQVPA